MIFFFFFFNCIFIFLNKILNSVLLMHPNYEKDEKAIKNIINWSLNDPNKHLRSTILNTWFKKIKQTYLISVLFSWTCLDEYFVLIYHIFSPLCKKEIFPEELGLQLWLEIANWLVTELVWSSLFHIGKMRRIKKENN